MVGLIPPRHPKYSVAAVPQLAREPDCESGRCGFKSRQSPQNMLLWLSWSKRRIEVPDISVRFRGAVPKYIMTDTFSPLERAKAKQEQREKDDHDLKTGKVTKEELRRRNSFVKGVDLSKSKIVKWD